ncbi:hypothetical protein FQA39_LY15585 [Lamprigera yunnana]|nr:hypothetical protein FQA39_LY15585 [Lamprigera yunnana]
MGLKNTDSEKDASSSHSQSDFSLQECGDSKLELAISDDGNEGEEVSLNELKEGTFILAKFKGGKRNLTVFVYRCVIQELREDGNIVVMGLKNTDSEKDASSSHSQSDFSLQECGDSKLELAISDDGNEGEEVSLNELKEGTFILAKFKGGKRNLTVFVYRCVIQELREDGNIVVMGLKNTDSEKDASSSHSQSDFSLQECGDSKLELAISDDGNEGEEVSLNELKEGTFILAKFKGGKRNLTVFVYRCVIQELREDGNIVVMGLKNTDSEKDASSSHSQSDFSLQECGDSKLELAISDDGNEGEEVSLNELKEGTFILAKFKGGKRNLTVFVYRCVIQELREDGNIVVMGLKNTDSEKEYVAEEKDICEINLKEIVRLVEEPELIVKGERVSYRFKKSLNVF